MLHLVCLELFKNDSSYFISFVGLNIIFVSSLTMGGEFPLSTLENEVLNSNNISKQYTNIPIIMARRLNQEARKEESPIKGNPFSYKSKKRKKSVEL